MREYTERIEACIAHLRAIEFPGADWIEDGKYFDRLEGEFARVPEDDAGKQLHRALMALIDDKRASSLNRNKTTEELFAGWND